MNLKEAFKIRKIDAESDEVIITISNHLATEQTFQSEEEAQKVIDATDWNQYERDLAYRHFGINVYIDRANMEKEKTEKMKNIFLKV